MRAKFPPALHPAVIEQGAAERPGECERGHCAPFPKIHSRQSVAHLRAVREEMLRTHHPFVKIRNIIRIKHI